MELVSFKKNHKEYVFLLENDTIKYGIKENGKVNKKLSEEEIEMMNYICPKIIFEKLDKNYIKCRCLKYKNKTFLQVFDKVSSSFSFFEIRGNKYISPTKEEIDNLNKIFHKRIYEYLKKKKNWHRNKKMVYGLAAYFITFSSFFGLGNLIDDGLYKPYIIEKFIDDNDNLSNEEKEFIISHLDMIKDNIEYIDFQEVLANMENLDIEYIEEPDEYCISEHAAAYYSLLDDKIVIANTDSFETTINDSSLTSNLSHEITHTFSSDIPEIGVGLMEATTETLTYEYGEQYSYDTSDYAYFEERMCLYSLCEIIGTDSFKKLHFQSDVNPLIHDLTNIIDDRKMATELISEIDSLNEYQNRLKDSILLDNETYAETHKEYRETKNDIYSKIKSYFETKYGYDMTEDETMMLYLVYSGFSSLDYKNKNGESIYATYIAPKGYFKEEYIEEHPNTIYSANVSYWLSDDAYYNIPAEMISNGEGNIIQTDNFSVDYFLGYIVCHKELNEMEIKNPIRENNQVKTYK